MFFIIFQVQSQRSPQHEQNIYMVVWWAKSKSVNRTPPANLRSPLLSRAVAALCSTPLESRFFLCAGHPPRPIRSLPRHFLWPRYVRARRCSGCTIKRPRSFPMEVRPQSLPLQSPPPKSHPEFSFRFFLISPHQHRVSLGIRLLGVVDRALRVPRL